MRNKKIKNNKTRGFTLVELMVSTSIFAIIMLASIGSLFTLLGASKDSRATQTALDNVNFALESMTRSIRMGSNYVCTIGGNDIPDDMDGTVLGGIDCPNGDGTAISFLPQSEGQNLTTYTINCDPLSNFCTLERMISGNRVQVVSDAVNITKLNFLVNGTGINSQKQPNVFIKLKGEVKVKDKTVPFNIQTFITQRNH